eukprot:5330495-Amphidinium_carterae.1
MNSRDVHGDAGREERHMHLSRSGACYRQDVLEDALLLVRDCCDAHTSLRVCSEGQAPHCMVLANVAPRARLGHLELEERGFSSEDIGCDIGGLHDGSWLGDEALKWRQGEITACIRLGEIVCVRIKTKTKVSLSDM